MVMRSLLRAAVGCFCAAVILVTDVLPHRHSDSSIEISFLEAIGSSEAQIIRCTAGNSGATHFDPERTVRVDPCLACVRDHAQGTTRQLSTDTPDRIARFLPVIARIAYARSIRLRRESRAPPTLPS
jgi:hypothetical protein